MSNATQQDETPELFDYVVIDDTVWPATTQSEIELIQQSLFNDLEGPDSIRVWRLPITYQEALDATGDWEDLEFEDQIDTGLKIFAQAHTDHTGDE